MTKQFLDIFIITILFLSIYKLIRRTEAFKISLGLLIIFGMYYVSDKFGLVYSATIFKKIFDLSPIGLIVLFQSELRMLLRKIGGITHFKQSKLDVMTSIEDAVFNMSKEKVGALVLFDLEKKVTFHTDDMVYIDSVCSKELLETIFFKNSPLHDGAVIVHGDRIAYAGCKLPLTASKREEYGHLGTRHLAALETAEKYDIISVVVSEETGDISIATNRGIRKIETREKFRLFFRKENSKNLVLKKLKGRIDDIKRSLK